MGKDDGEVLAGMIDGSDVGANEVGKLVGQMLGIAEGTPVEGSAVDAVGEKVGVAVGKIVGAEVVGDGN